MKNFIFTQKTNAKNMVNRILNKLKQKHGSSEMVGVVILIVVVLIIAVVVFLPGITSFFEDVVFPGLKTQTDKLFNFAG